MKRRASRCGSSYSWSSVPGAGHYFVLVIDTTTNQVPAYNSNVISTSWQPSIHLTPGHHYTWYVGAYSTNGLGGTWNAGQTFFLGFATPTQTGPSGLINASVGFDFPTYSWN